MSSSASKPTEEVIWEGHPSHALNFWLNLGCLLILPIPWAFVRWLQLRNNRIEITTERIRITTGIFSKRSEELELYRVRDTTFDQPFLLRLFNKGTLQITSNDASTPVIRLEAIPSDPALRDNLRRAIEACRDRKRARVGEWSGVMDVEDMPPPQ